MKRVILFVFIICSANQLKAQTPEQIWDDFKDKLKNDRISLEMIKPMEELGDEFKPVLLSFLDSLRIQASDIDWIRKPEIISQGNKILYIIPWTTRFDTANYCLTLRIIDSKWYFEHIESIFIRLDKYEPLPKSTFPDIAEYQKAWMREENFWSYIIINFYLPISKNYGQTYALDLLKDGAGYNVAAKAWVPFLPDHKAFILYLCWEQSKLRGNNVTLNILDENESEVTIESQYLAIYYNSGHMRNVISIEEYKTIFETIWKDRTKYSGWNIKIDYINNYTARLLFER
jgi:hypothetical protein